MRRSARCTHTLTVERSPKQVGHWLYRLRGQRSWLGLELGLGLRNKWLWGNNIVDINWSIDMGKYISYSTAGAVTVTRDQGCINSRSLYISCLWMLRSSWGGAGTCSALDEGLLAASQPGRGHPMERRNKLCEAGLSSSFYEAINVPQPWNPN